MHVCIDIQSAVAQLSGVGRYTKELVEHLLATAGTDRFSLFCFDFKRQGRPFGVAGADLHVNQLLPGRLVRKGWATIGFPPFDWLAPRADVYHFPNFVRPPLSQGKSVVTIHDLAFLRYPETLDEGNRRFLASQVGPTVAAADALIVPSGTVAEELAAAFPAARGKIHAIWLGIGDAMGSPTAAQIEASRKALGLAAPYLLVVGTLEPRKNVTFAVEVFERLQRFDGELVLAGMAGWKFAPILERIRASPAAARIRHLRYVSEDLLPGLYGGAELFVFPSLYEGFGFPPLEAMAAGTPVISSAGGSLAEVLGDAAVVVHGFDVEAWVEQVDRLLEDGGLRADLRSRGQVRVRAFSWRETARRTLDVYRGVLGT